MKRVLCKEDCEHNEQGICSFFRTDKEEDNNDQGKGCIAYIQKERRD